ncbi:class I SAM-dependent methyltransferase [Paenibacillus brevis]|uniref:Class I SAM-dependent methyltransferase n=1 Tax=Paenibacillus brevis TaxID=2841508 RepID=A0ABS6FJD6_9BACL|nr:class I SAM-dependent methyltransferase [Paenibacillus brevis]MBU5670287.1 class I SAM-dependent methyltransferase [Paenibacillus brevis]
MKRNGNGHNEQAQLKAYWQAEEARDFQGWDFSRLSGRMVEQELPWDYREAVLEHMKDGTTLLDMGTGGGEFLLSLSPPRGSTYATEAYLPNVELCKKKLPAYGIEVRAVEQDEELPFESGMFDMVINRHESFCIPEVWRVLKPGGLFFTQQVGGQNNRELSRFLLGEDASDTDPGFNLYNTVQELEPHGFSILKQEEYFPELTFLDIGALVQFARIIEWEFPGFTVERCYPQLMRLQNRLQKDGKITTREHRFMVIARKPEI